MQAEWGAAIRARIERRKVYPAAAAGVQGIVTLRLTVAADGRLAGVTVGNSSGSSVLDTAAISAVTSAGRLPKAPAALGAGTSTFTLRIAFEG